MNYIVLDLEFNQSSIRRRRGEEAAPRCPFEIIQIGALKLDDDMETVQSLDRLVKPAIYEELHPFVSEITSISWDMLKRAKPFREVYKEFSDLTAGDNNVLCIWGMADIKELFRNASYHGLDTFLIPRKYINLQAYVSQYLCCPKGTNIGLRNASELLNIPIEASFHNAFNDAYYTAEIFKRVYNFNMKFRIYNPLNERVSSNTGAGRKTVDSENLIRQFVKMFGRDMTEDEKTIIKLAYMMGKTNQFQIEVPNK
ncbi:MAG: 3'-5' exonuclease [Bacillota bacterium]|nr:3'-5' exonuclease [Bacillota bacterium]